MDMLLDFVWFILEAVVEIMFTGGKSK